MAYINSRLPRQAKFSIALALTILVLIFSYFNLDLSSLSQYAQEADLANLGQSFSSSHATFSSLTQGHSQPQSLEAHQFWRYFAKVLKDGDTTSVLPDFESLEKTAGWVTFEGVREGGVQPDLLNLSDDQIASISRLHRTVVREIESISGQLPFVAGTRGIVTTAGPTADAILVTSLRMLRKSGSRLPVQVWLLDETEYDAYLCEDILRPMDAQCMLMSDYLPEDALPTGDAPLEISHHFQMKILSIMFATFEQVLFLDCDLFPVNNPDSIFVTEPFISSGWVLWPDYWANTNSKLYGQIVGKPQAVQYDRASTESGAMLVDKSSHHSAILLAAYYNRYGPGFWYWLFSQGAIGHGDKDTYLPAVEYLGLPIYQVEQPPRRVGYRCDGGERAIGSAQSHPYDDWLLTSNNVSRAHSSMLQDLPEPRILFMHGNLPKNDPVGLMEWSIPDSWDDQLRCDHGRGQAHRQWGAKENTILKYGYDVEKDLWDQMRWLACTHADLKRWKDGYLVNCTDKAIAGNWCPATARGQIHAFSQPVKDLCKNFVALYEEVLPHEKYDASLPETGSPELSWTSIAGGRLRETQ